jgi:hypothetical protein
VNARSARFLAPGISVPLEEFRLEEELRPLRLQFCYRES